MQKMKFFLFAFMLSFFFWTTFAAYQQQWFTTFQENWSTVAFSCEKQCFILLWTVWTNEMISLQWSTQGWGQLWYWFLVGDKIYPWEIIAWQASFNKTFAFSQVQLFSQLPKEQTQIVVLVNWALQSSWLTIDYWKLFFSEKIKLWWNDFWIFDTFKPYTINLLKWPILFWKSANNFLFYLALFFGIIWYIVYKNKKKTFFSSIIMFLFIAYFLIDIRMWTEIMRYYNNDIQQYVLKPNGQKEYRDRWLFYSFVDYSQSIIGSGQKNIAFFSDISWPFAWSMQYFLYPHRVSYNQLSWNIDYVIIYEFQNNAIQWNVFSFSWQNFTYNKRFEYISWAMVLSRN